jgi:hypothetical protein
MVSEKEILEQQMKAQQEQESKDPLKHIELLEEKQKADELKWQERERELLIKIASQTEESKEARKYARDAQQKAKVAEYKYLNQQKQQIDGTAALINPEEEKNPERKARQIFVERLKARREKSQKTEGERKNNTYYI